MAESKSAALPLGYVPKPAARRLATDAWAPHHSESAPARQSLSARCAPLAESAHQSLALPGTCRYKAALRFGPTRQPKGFFTYVEDITVGRSVAQPGSALASGARGREFESPRSDQCPQTPDNRPFLALKICSGRGASCVALAIGVGRPEPYSQPYKSDHWRAAMAQATMTAFEAACAAMALDRRPVRIISSA